MNAATRYTTGAIAFHWIIATLIALNFVAVWVAHTMAKPERAQIMANHKAIGLTVLALSVLRIVWRLMHPAPPFAAGVKPWEAMLARTVQGLFYFLMIGIPLTGWMMVSAFGGGEPVSWFGLFNIPGLPFAQDRATGGTLHAIHENLGLLLLALLALHVAGALKHQWFECDGTLGRMIPWLRQA